MHEKKTLPPLLAAKTPGCSSWKPFIPPLAAAGQAEAATVLAHDALVDDEAVQLADPEGIDERLAAER